MKKHVRIVLKNIVEDSGRADAAVAIFNLCNGVPRYAAVPELKDEVADDNYLRSLETGFIGVNRCNEYAALGDDSRKVFDYMRELLTMEDDVVLNELPVCNIPTVYTVELSGGIKTKLWFNPGTFHWLASRNGDNVFDVEFGYELNPVILPGDFLPRFILEVHKE